MTSHDELLLSPLVFYFNICRYLRNQNLLLVLISVTATSVKLLSHVTRRFLTQSRSSRQHRPAVELHPSSPPLHQLIAQRTLGGERHQSAAHTHRLKQGSCTTHAHTCKHATNSLRFSPSHDSASYLVPEAGSGPSCHPGIHTPW